MAKQLYMWLLFVDGCEGLKKLQQQVQRALWHTVEWSPLHCSNVCQVEKPICGTIRILADELCCTLSLSKGNVLKVKTFAVPVSVLLGTIIADRCTHRLVKLLCSVVMTMNCDHCTETLTSLMVTIIDFTSKGKYLKCCSSVTIPGNTKVCTLYTSLKNLHGQCFCPYPAFLTLHHILICFVAWKVVRALSTQVIRHCRTSGFFGSTGKRTAVVIWECMILFKGGRGILTKMETTLKNNFALSSVVVKFCEICICVVGK